MVGECSPFLFKTSITQITNNIGNLAAEYSYDAWGRMRNVLNWQPYTQATLPTLKFGRGYTGHEQLNDFGLINMNARLYDPLLGRFLAPDPFVGSGLSNDFNRYVYARNNPLMYTDPSGKSWKSFWSDFGNAFVRDFKRTFLSGGPGFQIGYNSMGGGFVNATYNGTAFGSSVGISNSGKITNGNSQGGFHNMSSIGLSNRLDQSVVKAEQNARGEYFGQKTFESVYNSVIEAYHLTVTDGYVECDNNAITNNNNLNLTIATIGAVSGIGEIAEKSKGLNSVLTTRVSNAANLWGTYNAYSELYNGHNTELNWADAGTGTLGLSLNFLKIAGYDIPYLGEVLMIYSGLRLYYDYSNSNNNSSPIWNRLPNYKP